MNTNASSAAKTGVHSPQSAACVYVAMPIAIKVEDLSFAPFTIWESVARVARVTNERIALDQAITRAEALRCATVNGAYLSFDEDKKGSLEPGKLADLAVLSSDPLTVEEKSIPNISALMAGGQIVRESPNWNG